MAGRRKERRKEKIKELQVTRKRDIRGKDRNQGTECSGRNRTREKGCKSERDNKARNEDRKERQ